MKNDLSQKQKARDFVVQSNEGCRRCQNFGSFSCPNFRKAIFEQGINSAVLTTAIKADQEHKTLSSCSNA